MGFHLGKPLLVLSVLALASGLSICVLPVERPTDLHVWVFAESHAATYRRLVPAVERLVGKSVAVNDLGDSVTARLSALFSAGIGGKGLPSAAEIEIGSIGRFFGRRLETLGFYR